MVISCSSLSRATAIGMLVLASATPSMAQSRSQTEERNLQTVLAFYEKGLNEMDADGALAYFGDKYVNHNPNAEDGRDGFHKYVTARRAKSPKAHSEIKRSFMEGDYVVFTSIRCANPARAAMPSLTSSVSITARS